MFASAQGLHLHAFIFNHHPQEAVYLLQSVYLQAYQSQCQQALFRYDFQSVLNAGSRLHTSSLPSFQCCQVHNGYFSADYTLFPKYLLCEVQTRYFQRNFRLKSFFRDIVFFNSCNILFTIIDFFFWCTFRYIFFAFVNFADSYFKENVIMPIPAVNSISIISFTSKNPPP